VLCFLTISKGEIMATDNLLSEKDLADFMRVSVWKLRKDREKNRGIPFIKILRTVRYNMDDVNIFLNNNKKIPSQISI
jgi:hypothetical protein